MDDMAYLIFQNNIFRNANDPFPEVHKKKSSWEAQSEWNQNLAKRRKNYAFFYLLLKHKGNNINNCSVPPKKGKGGYGERVTEINIYACVVIFAALH